LRSREVVLYTPLFDYIFLDVINAISGAPIAITRLADAANVNEVFFRFLDCKLIDLHFLYAVIARECSRYVRMSKEANRGVLISETWDGIETVKDVAPLVRHIECRVDDREIANLPSQTQRAEPFLVFVRQLLARPIDRRFRKRIETAR
jgi:hypothetical protein